MAEQEARLQPFVTISIIEDTNGSVVLSTANIAESSNCIEEIETCVISVTNTGI